jgi:hypothetical protein
MDGRRSGAARRRRRLTAAALALPALVALSVAAITPSATSAPTIT